MSGKKVVIIGAGCAGLAAAYTLKKQNVDFVLLEASNRYGGRVGTEFRDGYSFERGAYFTEPQWSTTFKFFEELGLQDDIIELKKKVYGFWNKDKMHYFKDTGNIFGEILKFRGLPVSIIPQAAKFMLNLSKQMKLIGENHDFSALADVSMQSTAEWATEHGGPEVVDKLLDPFLGTMVLTQAKEVSIAHPIALMSLMKGMCLLKGGLGRLNDGLYEAVKDNVRFNTPVSKVVLENDKVKGVEIEGEFIHADQVILATDAEVARQIVPDLPDTIRKPLETCTYSTSYNYIFVLEKRIVPDHFLALLIPGSTNSLLTTIFDENSNNFSGPEGMGIMHAFTAGWHDEKFTSLNDEDRKRLVISEIQQFWPEFPDEPMHTEYIRYDKAVNLEAPGQYVAIQNMKENHLDDVKGLHLAGEYMFLIACTEGSWSTGVDAAERVLAGIKEEKPSVLI